MAVYFGEIVTFLVILYFSRAQSEDELVIQLKEPRARIRGHILKSYLGKDYYSFQDIPYAVPPLGEYRFAEPEAHPGWDGIFDATENKKTCMQPIDVETTEDCLVLNVYSPKVNSSAKLPVFFWIHGGAFLLGTGAHQARGPEYFMDHEVIVVTINYRLGVFGFLTTEDGIVPGNLGLKDQQLALKWVSKNIEMFGGDPKKVTIAGQSAGSISCSYHIISQKSTNLFRGAILESGTALVHGSYIMYAKNYAFQLGRLLDGNFTSSNSKALLKILRSTPADVILAASDKVRKIGKQVGLLADLVWGVVIENKNEPNAYVTKPMHQAFMEGEFDKTPLLMGYTSEEILSFISSLKEVKYAAARHDRNPMNLISYKLNIPKANQTDAGMQLKSLFTNKSFSRDLAGFVSFCSNIDVINPVIRTADLASKFVPVYLYQFAFEGTAHNQLVHVKIPGVYGMGHNEELFYLWDFHFSKEMSPNKHDRLTQKRLMKLWTDFVKYQNPTPTTDTALGIPIWPALKSGNLQYLDINNTLTIKKNPKKYLEIKDILDHYMQEPFNVY